VSDGRQAAAEEHHGAVDVVICCAGVAHPGTFEDTPSEEFERLMRINFMGTVRNPVGRTPQRSHCLSANLTANTGLIAALATSGPNESPKDDPASSGVYNKPLSTGACVRQAHALEPSTLCPCPAVDSFIHTCLTARTPHVTTHTQVNTVKAAYASVTRQPGGRVVLVSSQAGQVGIFGYTAYSSSKFALRGLAEALQMEVRNPRVASGNLSVGFLLTTRPAFGLSYEWAERA